MTEIPAEIYDRLERIALGMYGRKHSGFRDNERDPHYWGSGKPDWLLCQELLAEVTPAPPAANVPTATKGGKRARTTNTPAA